MNEEEDNNINNPYLQLYEENEMLRKEIERTRANARKWHRATQRIDKVEAENRWLRERLRKEHDDHNDLRRYHRTQFARQYKHLRNYITLMSKFIERNLDDKDVGANTYYHKIKVISKNYNHADYDQWISIVHPDDYTEEQKLSMDKRNYLPGIEIMVKRLVREKNQMKKKMEELLKTLA